MLRNIVLLLLAAGTVMWLYSLHLPYYASEEAKENLDNSIELAELPHKAYIDHYYKEIEKLRTPKAALEDAGSGLMVFSLLLLAVFFARDINSFGDVRKIGGLNRMPLIAFALMMWLLLLPGTWWYYQYRAVRGDYPWFADTIIIPIMQTSVFICAFFIVLLIALPLLTLRYRAAASVFIRARTYDAATILTEAFYGLLLTFTAFVIYDCMSYGDHVTIMVAMYFFYMFLALRAGWLTAMGNVRC